MNLANRRSGASLSTRLMIGTALSGLMLAGATGAGYAQPAAGGSDVETVVVTGTSIRGQAPVGSNLITVDRSAIESTGAQNVQQLLADVPGITGFGGPGQGGGNSDFAGGFAPAIHNIGGGSSSATLVLIDGHRFPTQGLTEAQADPTVLPTSALERVEVLPDGASSIYGSDAISGVLNFITRKDFTGAEFGAQYGIADSYSTSTVSGLFGKAWTGGSVLVAADVSNQSNLMFGTRSYMTTRQDIARAGQSTAAFTAAGANASTAPASGGIAALTTTPAAGPGTSAPYGATIPALSQGVNFQNFNCPVASISPVGSNTAYYYQPGGGYGGSPVYTTTSNVPSQGACDNNSYTSILPSATRNSGMIQVRQEITDNLVFDLEAVYGSRLTFQRASRGTIGTVTVFGPNAAAGTGSNATTQAAAAAGEVNPFFQGNTATGNASEVVRGYDFDALLGPGAGTKQLDVNNFVTSGLTWDLGNNQEIVIGGTLGENLNSQHVIGTVSPAEALLALNGTTNNAGTPGTTAEQDVFGFGTSYPVQRVLTTSNALDVWDPAGPTNKTSAQVINSLKSTNTFTNAYQGLQDFSAKFDGPVFALPAGDVKLAVGGEYIHTTMDEYGTSANAAGPTISNSNAYYYREGRTVWAAFVEVNVPLISPEMNVPLVQSFQIDASGRYDKYSDVGDTKNPKVAFDWVVTDGFKLRGSWGTSFVAPTIHDAQQFNSQSNIGAAGNFANRTIPFGDTRPFNGGAGLAGTWVSTPASCTAGHGTVVDASGKTYTGAAGQTQFGCLVNFGSTNTTSQSAGFSIPGGNNTLVPATGRSTELGFDADLGRLGLLDGLTVNLTYWDVNYRGLITNQQTMNNVPQLTTFAPIGGWTPTSPAIQSFIAGRPLTIAMPSNIWVLVDGRLQNAFNIWENGLDFGANYTLRTDNLGTFRFGASGEELLRYTTQADVAGAPLIQTKDGHNSPRYPSNELQARFTLGWAYEDFNAQLAANWVQGATNSFSTYPYNLVGQSYHQPALLQFNLSMNYALPSGLFGLPDMATDGSSVSLIIDNILDTNPPWTPNSANGYNSGNPIGRMVTIGFKKKW